MTAEMPTVAQMADRIRHWEALRDLAEATGQTEHVAAMDSAIERLYRMYMPRAAELVELETVLANSPREESPS